MMADITQAQVRKLWAVARELGLTDKLLHDAVWNITHKEHIPDLTKEEAIQVIDWLETFKEDRPDMVTKRQLWKIDQLVKELGWNDPKQLRGFLHKYAKVEHTRWLTKEQASKIIEGLKAILKKQTPQSGASNG
jgi:hypothetical protein